MKDPLVYIEDIFVNLQRIQGFWTVCPNMNLLPMLRSNMR